MSAEPLLSQLPGFHWVYPNQKVENRVYKARYATDGEIALSYRQVRAIYNAGAGKMARLVAIARSLELPVKLSNTGKEYGGKTKLTITVKAKDLPKLTEYVEIRNRLKTQTSKGTVAVKGLLLASNSNDAGVIGWKSVASSSELISLKGTQQIIKYGTSNVTEYAIIEWADK